MISALWRGTAAALWLFVVGTVLMIPTIGFTLSVPPLPALPDNWQAPSHQHHGSRQQAGKGQRHEVGEILWLELAGSPSDIGAAHGLLLADRINGLEADLLHTFVERVPTFIARHLLLGLVGFNNATLHRFFSDAEKQEIRAATAAPPAESDQWRAMGPAYQRALHYHALHDVSQYLIDNPLVRPIQVGCTAFAVGGQHSSNGNLIVGRLFDFEGGPRFDLDKVVFTVRPTVGHAFIHVAWPGLTGVVTGMNERGLWVSINAAASSDQSWVGRPIIMAVREILQHCQTLDEAEAVLRRSPVFVSNGILVVSRDEQAMAIFENGPSGLARRTSDHMRLISTNHFDHRQWADDARNQQRIREGTTTVRAARVAELLDQQAVDIPRALSILRDRQGLGGQEVGFHNRSTINAWIGAHLVLADVSRGILWVSEPRHGLGAMRAFNLDGPLPEEDLPADPELPRLLNDLPQYQMLRQQILDGIDDEPSRQAAVERILAINPHSFEAHWLAGLFHHDPEQRRAHLKQALKQQPAYPADRRAIEQALEQGSTSLQSAAHRPGSMGSDP